MDYVGKIFTHPKYGDFLVKELIRVDKEQGYKKYYNIVFLNTGFSYEVDRNSIRQNMVKDYYSPQVYGVGFLGDEYKSINQKVSSLWRGMLGRCYSKTNASFKSYGAKGVTVCERWHNYTNFANDITKIEGYDEYDFYNGNLHLDKDIKQQDVQIKTYSPELCMFVNPSRNMEEQEATRYFKAISPTGELFEGKNIKKFCEEHDLDYTSVYSVMNKTHNYRHRGWVFGDENETIDSLLAKQSHGMRIFYALNIESGKIEKSIGIKGFAEKYGLSMGNISMCLTGRRKHPYRDWKFFDKEEDAKNFLTELGSYP